MLDSFYHMTQKELYIPNIKALGLVVSGKKIF